jgi:hypothetical protein
MKKNTIALFILIILIIGVVSLIFFKVQANSWIRQECAVQALQSTFEEIESIPLYRPVIQKDLDSRDNPYIKAFMGV